MSETELIRTAHVTQVNTQNSPDGFSVRIDNDNKCIVYSYSLPIQDGKSLLFQIKCYNDYNICDLYTAVKMFTKYIEYAISDNLKMDATTQEPNFAKLLASPQLDNLYVKKPGILNMAKPISLPQQASTAQRLGTATHTVQNLTQKNQPNVNFDVAVFGVPNGFDMDTNVTNPDYRKWLEESVSHFYNNIEIGGIQFVVHKQTYQPKGYGYQTNTQPQKVLSYNFLVYPKDNSWANPTMPFVSAKGRPGSFFGLCVILPNGIFVEPKQMYNILHNFYYKHVVGKYIEHGDSLLRHVFPQFNQCNITQEFNNYITECIQNNELNIEHEQISLGPRPKWLKVKLNQFPKDVFQQFLQKPDVQRITLLPENTNPLTQTVNKEPLSPAVLAAQTNVNG